MVIPYYWAEARLQHKTPSRQITVQRWGWSDISQEDAQLLADQRAQEAMTRIESGEKLRRREPKAAYDCVDNVPIREEVVSQHGNAVITRNSYGSLCLNTPDVFFADVDASPQGMLQMSLRGCLLLVVLGVVTGILTKSVMAGLGLVIGLPWLASAIMGQINKQRLSRAEAQAKEEALTAIEAFSTGRPAWYLRVYETPAGYRLLAMHDLFDPAGDAAKEALEALNADKRFVRLCAVQGCFRARVSPKYWRMKYKVPLSLPKSKWPFPKEHVPLRQQWIEAYDQRSPKYASCRFIKDLGSGIVHPEAEAVRAVHDAYCRAQSDLPLA
ncbi:hypothetical protein [Prosthecobacter sp.]|uniref:hypothetical protein n=1 Tax=Prosthecobacter sp. TaxID=1965333 RepID=UPI003784EA47